MTWMVNETSLDQEQRLFIDSALQLSRNSLIEGPAGAGKSVILVHSINHFVHSINHYRKDHPAARVCMVLFTHSLIDMMRSAVSEDSNVEFYTTYSFRRTHGHWDLIAIDEIQDVDFQTLRQVFQRGQKIIMAGDFGQTIYDSGCDYEGLGRAGAFEKKSFLTIYRLTASIQRIAALFADNPEEFISYAVDKYIKNVTVQLVKNADRKADMAHSWSEARRFAESSYSAAILLPNNAMIRDFVALVLSHEGQAPWRTVYDEFNKPDYYALNGYLQQVAIPLQVIGRGAGSMRQADADNLVSVMTYHSAKGLDFEAVCIPRLDADTTIWSRDGEIERRLFFVALTRSRQDLFLSYSGHPHPFLQRIPEHYVQFRDRSGVSSNAVTNDPAWNDPNDPMNFDF